MNPIELEEMTKIQKIIASRVIQTKKDIKKSQDDLLGVDFNLFSGSNITYLQKLIHLLTLKSEIGLSVDTIQEILYDNHATLPKGSNFPSDYRTLFKIWTKSFSLVKLMRFLICEKGIFHSIFI